MAYEKVAWPSEGQSCGGWPNGERGAGHVARSSDRMLPGAAARRPVAALASWPLLAAGKPYFLEDEGKNSGGKSRGAK